MVLPMKVAYHHNLSARRRVHLRWPEGLKAGLRGQMQQWGSLVPGACWARGHPRHARAYEHHGMSKNFYSAVPVHS